MLSFFFLRSFFISFSHLCVRVSVCWMVQQFTIFDDLMWNCIRFVTFSPSRLAHNFTFLVSLNYWSCSLAEEKNANFSKNSAPNFVNFSINVNFSHRQAFHINVLYLFFVITVHLLHTTSIVSFVVAVVVVICHIICVVITLVDFCCYHHHHHHLHFLIILIAILLVTFLPFTFNFASVALFVFGLATSIHPSHLISSPLCHAAEKCPTSVYQSDIEHLLVNSA